MAALCVGCKWIKFPLGLSPKIHATVYKIAAGEIFGICLKALTDNPLSDKWPPLCPPRGKSWAGHGGAMVRGRLGRESLRWLISLVQLWGLSFDYTNPMKEI